MLKIINQYYGSNVPIVDTSMKCNLIRQSVLTLCAEVVKTNGLGQANYITCVAKWFQNEGHGRNEEMDTSNEYVKMCEMAHELRETKFPAGHLTDGDFIAYRVKSNGNEVVAAVIGEEDTMQLHADVCGDKVEYWWLPRQDQIQKNLLKTVLKEDKIPLFFLRQLYEWLWIEYERNHDHGVVFDTMEKVWLAFLMDKKYGKKWIQEKWRESYSDN